MRYRVLSLEERQSMLVTTLLAQERDHFIHTTNLERYELILQALSESSEVRAFAQQLQQMVTETRERLLEVTYIIQALNQQIEDAMLEVISQPILG